MATDTQFPGQSPQMGADIPMDPMGQEMEPMQDDGSFTVCLAITADGELSVGVKPGVEGSESYSPARDRKDLLTQALEIIKAGGDASAATPKAAQSASFAAGYEED